MSADIFAPVLVIVDAPSVTLRLDMSAFVHHAVGMDPSGETKWNLAKRMEERVRELGITWNEVLRRADLKSRQNLIDIRNETKTPRSDTRRKIERALELAVGGFEQMERGEKPAAAPPRHVEDQEARLRQSDAQLAPLEEVLTADLDGLKTLARMYAWYMARQEDRAANIADQERFMLWALQVRADKRNIEPRDAPKRDVS